MIWVDLIVNNRIHIRIKNRNKNIDIGKYMLKCRPPPGYG